MPTGANTTGNKQLALWVDKVFRGDEIFNPASPLNLDDRLSSARLLRERLKDASWDCHTADLYLARDLRPDAVLFFDIPPQPLARLIGMWGASIRKLAVLYECSVIKPQNWRKPRHEEFDVIFTWADGLVDGKKYFKINASQRIPSPAEFLPGNKEKLCVLIAGNKKSPHPLELYSERVRTIRWFEANHPADFDLFGTGWDKHLFTGPLPVRALNRIAPLARLAAERRPSYRGAVRLKKDVLAKYKFSICYENSRVPGYITEKIFDSMFAGCVPVYWGAPDIGRHVPAGCFIDRRAFCSHEALYAYLKAMPDAEYAGRLSAIRDYLAGDRHYQFSDRYFAETVAGVVAAE